MNFLSAPWLWLLLVIPVIYYLYMEANKRKKTAAMKFSNVGLIKAAMKKTSKRQRWIFILYILIIFLLVFALANPTLPLKTTKKGVNVVLAIDISGSMQATDYKPNRLESAKRSAELLVKELKPNDLAGLVVFESGATTAAYLSPLKSRVVDKLRNIAPKEGRTAIGDGLSLAVDMAVSVPNKKNVVILLSDGVNNAGVISPGEAVAFARENKIKVFTIGLGSEKPVVLGHDWFGRAQYAELDEKTLISIAEQTGGEYYKSVDDKTLSEIYDQLSKKIEREKEETSIKDYVLVFVLLLVLFEFYVRFGRGRIIQ